MTNVEQYAAIGILSGALLGIFYFGGLWLTVIKLPGRKNSGRLLLYSFIVRVIPVLAGFVLTARHNPVTFFIAIATFFFVRIIMVRVIGRNIPNKEATDAVKS